MIEKVNPRHPDKVADRIAGAMVDLAYEKAEAGERRPRIAVEVLAGHGRCNIIAETSEHFDSGELMEIVKRVSGEDLRIDYVEVQQDPELAKNQEGGLRCGDNGIFKGVPLTSEEVAITDIVRAIYDRYPTDGKFIYADGEFIACQSCAYDEHVADIVRNVVAARYAWLPLDDIIVNPIGPWTGGLSTDSGATNRKLGSDMAGSVTGGGLHGKDLSKADVSANIYAFCLAQKLQRPVKLYCAIGDTEVTVSDQNGIIDSVPYVKVVGHAQRFIRSIGGFEKLAEWGLF